jgi:hypothetical protein
MLHAFVAETKSANPVFLMCLSLLRKQRAALGIIENTFPVNNRNTDAKKLFKIAY